MYDKPVFVQLMEMIENNIIADVWKPGELIISSTQICKLYNVNPATAMRALNELVDYGILIKDRGIGMRLTNQAKALVLKKREKVFFSESLANLVEEAKKLGIDQDQLTKMIEKTYEEKKND